VPPRISVVVPIYNVEAYLEPCLDSAAAQTMGDLDVVMVDDGSTDGSAAIARDYARRDSRFRLLTQPNGGLSAARNTGMDAAECEFLAFLDSDDLLPENAYELLLNALDQTGSDFASGNVQRLTRWSTTQSRFVAKVFGSTRLKTHITKFRPLLADRTAWNKLFRRSFWDSHGLRFPEGRVHEDIPVILPAHFMAKSVDLVSDPVYLYRARDDGDLSITQRRLETKVLLDRLQAIEEVRAYLKGNESRRARRWYDQSIVADDLRLHVNILDNADDAYRELFLDRVNALLDDADSKTYDRLLAIDRLKYHLVRRRLMPELLEVLRFAREDLAATPPVRHHGRWYGDYPFRTDPRLDIPQSVYRLDQELALEPTLEELRVQDGKLRVSGHAYVSGIGADSPESQQLSLSALRGRRLRRLRLRTTALRLPTKTTERPDVTANDPKSVRDLTWSGFEATLDPRRLRTAGRWMDGTWDVYATTHHATIKRRRARFDLEPLRPLGAVELPSGDGALVRAAVSYHGRLQLEVRRRWVAVTGHRREDDAIVLTCEGPLAAEAVEVRRERESRARTYPVSGGAVRIPLADLKPKGDPTTWELEAVAGSRRAPLALGEHVPAGVWGAVTLHRTWDGDAALVHRPPRTMITGARWTPEGDLELDGDLPEELVLASEERGEQHVVAPPRLTPARMATLAGTLPLGEGTWRLFRAADMTAVVVEREAAATLPASTVVERKPFAFGASRDGRALLRVERDLADDERGGYHQRRLRAGAYAARRRAPLRDAVVYLSYGGRQTSDGPLALQRELVRRDAPLEHLWVVLDGQCLPPPGATALREGSRDFHEALATARYVVTNDLLPDWFERRDDQVCVQTWHGTPVKRLGPDVEGTRNLRRFRRDLDHQVANWQYVVSPNPYSTPVLRDAYGIEGELLETGYPRVDVLLGDDREQRAAAVRERLGLPEGRRVVLYAPTFRDHLVDRGKRLRLDLRLDLEELRRAAGEDTVVLFRKHHAVTDVAPSTADGFVRDVSRFPDANELLLATDVLITDYSSLMVDFANTGRPMLFYAYDLEDYARGFYVDYEATVPGPVLRGTGEVGEALRGLDAVRAAHAERYDAFRDTFCALDDGRASARVVDRVWGG
jgi:CDP-glycerol glycerophosphotransferase